MTILGLDFDNTLVEYDDIFYKTALEKKLINKDIKPNKIAIRDYLRQKGQEEDFTILQGEVYGYRIIDAKPRMGMMKALLKMKENGVKMKLISHKTQYPYKGKKYDLREAAMAWLEKNGFTSMRLLNWKEDIIFFENTKEQKVQRIIQEKCTHYIDDLEEILEQIPAGIKKIHYTKNRQNKEREYSRLTEWKDLITLVP